MKIGLRERLAAGGVILTDGAMGTMLQASGLREGEAPESLNLRQPERVLAVHLAYVAAGAEMIGTNTFGGNRVKLTRAGLAERMVEVNRAAVEVARQAAGSHVYVAGEIGPSGELLEPFGSLGEQEARVAFVEQARLLADGGVDLFLIETLSDLSEARLIISAVREVSDLPILCSLSFDTGGRTMMGVSPAQAANVLSEAGVDGFGANCGQGPEDMESVLKEMLVTRPGAVVIAQPNAGVPSLEGDRAVYGANPDTMAEYARRYAAMGVKVIGACCGSTPAHIEAIARALEGYR